MDIERDSQFGADPSHRFRYRQAFQLGQAGHRRDDLHALWYDDAFRVLAVEELLQCFTWYRNRAVSKGRDEINTAPTARDLPRLLRPKQLVEFGPPCQLRIRGQNALLHEERPPVIPEGDVILILHFPPDFASRIDYAGKMHVSLPILYFFLLPTAILYGSKN